MNAILACDIKGGIGYQNKLPWTNIQGDLVRFKNLTKDQVIVMGRNTWDSLPKKPLSNRLNLVVTNKKLELPPGALAINNLNHFSNFKSAWIIGGSQLISSSWDLIDQIYLTRTLAEYTCDTYIDLVKLQKEFNCISVENNIDHTFEIWRRNENLPRIV